MKLPATNTLPPETAQTTWGRMLTLTPVVMTVVATLLAGLSSSEMTSAQYYRALAAQEQSKASDQWSFFQAKRARTIGLNNTLEVLQTTTDPGRFEPSRMTAAAEGLPARITRLNVQAKRVSLALDPLIGQPGTEIVSARNLLEDHIKNASKRTEAADKLRADLAAIVNAPETPTLIDPVRSETSAAEPALDLDPKIKAAVEAIEASKPEAEIAPLIAAVDPHALAAAFVDANNQTGVADAANKPATSVVDRIDKTLLRYALLAREPYSVARRLTVLLAESTPAADPAATTAARDAANAFLASASSLQTEAQELRNDFTAVRLHFATRRYDAEARANQATAGLYEVQIRQSGARSERHRLRSQRFFFGMLAAQAAVVISSLSLAVRRRNLLWSFAAAAGLAAAAFGAYVYLYV